MDVVTILKTLAEENRLRLFNVLSQKTACVCELEALLDLNQANVSRHLANMRSAGIVIREKEGQWIRYRISETFIEKEAEFIGYLKNKLLDNEMIIADNLKLGIYNQERITCVEVKQSPGKVFTVLHQK